MNTNIAFWKGEIEKHTVDSDESEHGSKTTEDRVEDTTKDDAPNDDAPNDDAPNDDAQNDDGSKQNGSEGREQPEPTVAAPTGE